MNWNASAHKLIVGDFNGDGRDDVLLQATPGLASGVMLAAAKGGFTRAPQGPFTTIGGMDVSQASHTLQVGDFNGDGRDDLLLQANNTLHDNAISLAGPDGEFTTLAARWPDYALGFNWSNDLTTITVGDFAGTGRAELLLRARNTDGASRCCEIVALNPHFQPATVVQHWSADYLGLDWSSTDYQLIAADLNDDGRTDLLLQPTAPGGTVTVLLANAQGHFTTVAAQWPAEQDGRDWSSESYLLVPEPAKVPGEEGSLLMVPRQVGLPYVRVQFDSQGRPVKTTTLSSPPVGLLAQNSEDPNIDGDALSAMQAQVFPQPHTGGSAVGALPGSFSVGAMGEARYRIPIAVAPGVNGMQPDLALSYDSRSGQTQLGLGWSLSGLSAISRCPATVAVDGASRPVEMDASDDFCLDGAHLVAYPGQNYGASGTEYHTPTASFQKVVSNGTQGSGPQSFTVWGKDGLVREYGATTDSNLQGGQYYSNTAFVWLLDKITDRWGNYITFQYTKSQDVSGMPGEDTSYQLSEIDYDNNAGTTVGKLMFSYQLITADHWSVAYMDGLTHIFKSLLSSITVESAGSTLWSYDFSYSTPDVGSPRLVSVDECDGAGDCLAPTNFQYVPVSSGLGGLTAMTTDDNMSYRYLGDLDGDGRTDLIFPENGDWEYVTSAQRETVNTGIAVDPHPGQAVVLDANDDGYSDLLFPVSGGKAEREFLRKSGHCGLRTLGFELDWRMVAQC